MVGILGKKLGMTEIFDEKGHITPVTLIEAGPCFVTKTEEHEGKQILQVGFLKKKTKKTAKNQAEFIYLRSFSFSGDYKYKNGEELKVTVLEGAKLVDIQGISKGRGFTGVVKRHGFSGGPKTHGHRHVLRSLGSVGMCSFPGEVAKGKKMAGHFGHTNVTIKNLEVVRIDLEKNLLLVKGGIPGANGEVVQIVAKEVNSKEIAETKIEKSDSQTTSEKKEADSKKESKGDLASQAQRSGSRIAPEQKS